MITGKAIEFTPDLTSALWRFWDKYWNDTGVFECDDYDYKYSYILNSDVVELDELGGRIEELLT